MPEQMGGLTYWQIRFDEKGRVHVNDRDALRRELPQQRRVRHLFVFSHGWNNDTKMARDLYDRFFGQMTAVMSARNVDPRTCAGVGVIWPSMRWADEEPAPRAGGAAGARARRAPRRSDSQLARDLKAVYKTARQRKAIDGMARLLEERPRDAASRKRFQKLLAELAPRKVASEDDGERALLKKRPEEVFSAMAPLARTRGRRPAAAGIGDWLWDGAKEALRAVTYWQMKERAGVVGERGLGPLLNQVHASAPAVAIHMLGHSFGARLISFSLKSIVGTPAPVKSLVLLQGAFSHFAFADALPHDRRRGGALKSMASRVDGPILVTHSRRDTALSVFYEKASLISRADASAAGGVSRWGAMGGGGAQAVNATRVNFNPVGSGYAFVPGAFFNLDGNRLIVNGSPPSGAHSDIVYDKIAWAVLCGAGIA